MFFDPFDRGVQGRDDTKASPWITSFLGLSSVFAAVGLLSQAHLGSSIKLLILGSIIETGRRLFQWLIVRFRFQYSMTAQFDEGDPAYEWIVLFLPKEGVWRRSREFVVTATNSRRKSSVRTWFDPTVKGNAEYVPTYQRPQLFRWRGHWLEIKRSKEAGAAEFTPMGTLRPTTSIYLTIYTLDMNLLSELVEEARGRYIELNRPNVIIHLADSPHYGPGMIWTNTKHKVRRPLSSVILPEGVVDALVHDAQEFLTTENWYVEAGIPHRRGYLLYGPPGTGKTSTIHALAGALNLENFSLSLASSFVDDSFLQRAASSIPKHALFLIEDIDCAFVSRDDEDDLDPRGFSFSGGGRANFPAGRGFVKGNMSRGNGEPVRSLVTLSGLLNVIDGVGSEEGKLFFATVNHLFLTFTDDALIQFLQTNYIDRLDAALLRPGRIDRKVQYELSTVQQARALFIRFFPETRFPEFASSLPLGSQNDQPSTKAEMTVEPKPACEKNKTILVLADAFAEAIPQGEFSTAELQGYLQSHKTTPAEAAAGAGAWVEEIRAERHASEEREEARRRKARARREGIETKDAEPTGTGL
ncbi:P-loop containing nucleoside triphosphate hydrolase protein [Mycena metata]|uniref:P-loop containing nucleoside triphosphate hydrolase protein n=1 Tax=Mycena metata TaxID=1033252 RepID=A0AAD7K7B8_9AGAR|nr:P-loop containing nucleoside triphosphate hydrolase protein [Mycena metata]